MNEVRHKRAVSAAIVILLMASTASAAPKRYTFTGTVNEVYALLVETSVAMGDDVGFILVLDFDRDATIDPRLVQSFGFSTLSRFLGGFHAELLTGSLEGPAASGCFGL